MATVIKHFFFVSIFFSALSFAQIDKERFEKGEHHFSPVTFEAIPYWTHDTASIDLIVLYRVSSALLYFSKTANTQQDTYSAQGEIIVEVFDENGNVTARELRPLQMERYSLPAKDIPDSQDMQGAFIFKLKKGIYRIVLEAKDSESGKSFINRDTKIDAQIDASQGLKASQMILIESTQSDTISTYHTFFVPVNQGGNILIGQTGGVLFQVVSQDTSHDFSLSWNVSSKNNENEDFTQELSGNQYSERSGTFDLKEEASHISFLIKKDSMPSRFIYIPIHFERLNPGNYTLAVTLMQGSLKSAKEYPLKVLWPLRPRSLSDFPLAVDALKYIATEKEIDEMNSTSSKSRKAFSVFWKKYDSDTTNAYNPAMAEYYRRVDESIKRFSTTNEFDGYRTDRGRIYILFGAPTVNNRLLKPNKAPTEIWTYEKMKQRFTFSDSKKNGNYILTKMENY
jgi:GWxTD domain-containing protein